MHPRRQRRLPPVDGDLVGEVRVAGADPGDGSVGDHAVEAVVGGAGGDDDELAVGLRQARASPCPSARRASRRTRSPRSAARTARRRRSAGNPTAPPPRRSAPAGRAGGRPSATTGNRLTCGAAEDESATGASWPGIPGIGGPCCALAVSAGRRRPGVLTSIVAGRLERAGRRSGRAARSSALAFAADSLGAAPARPPCRRRGSARCPRGRAPRRRRSASRRPRGQRADRRRARPWSPGRRVRGRRRRAAPRRRAARPVTVSNSTPSASTSDRRPGSPTTATGTRSTTVMTTLCGQPRVTSTEAICGRRGDPRLGGVDVDLQERRPVGDAGRLAHLLGRQRRDAVDLDRADGEQRPGPDEPQRERRAAATRDRRPGRRGGAGCGVGAAGGGSASGAHLGCGRRRTPGCGRGWSARCGSPDRAPVLPRAAGPRGPRAPRVRPSRRRRRPWSSPGRRAGPGRPAPGRPPTRTARTARGRRGSGTASATIAPVTPGTGSSRAP